MTNSEPQPAPRKILLSGTSSGASQDSADLTVSSAALTWSQTQAGEWNLDRAQHELKAGTQAHRQREAAEEARFRREEAAKNNDQRRWQQRLLFRVVIGGIAVGSVFSMAVIALADNTESLARAWSLLSLIMGGLIGGVAGYFTGKGGR